MKQRLFSKKLAGLILSIGLLVISVPMAQPPSGTPDEQILPPIQPVEEEAGATSPSLRGGRPGRASGYSAGQVGEATFQIDMDTGSLIVLTDDQTDEHIQTILKNLDRPVPQVLIKVLFLEVTHTNTLDLGVEARYLAGSDPDAAQYTPYLTNANGTILQNPTIIGPGDLNQMGNPMAPGELDLRDTLETAFGVGSETRGGFYRIISNDLEATIRAIATVGKLEVLSRPSILTRNNELARIQIGESVPLATSVRYVTGTNEPITSVEYRDTGIILEVTPHITAEGLVEMEVAPEISSLNRAEPLEITTNVFAYPITERYAETKVIVPNGMTVVIGGLMRDQETETVSKVPILGDIPWAGWLFKRTVKSKQKTELIIFLTPHVVEKTPHLETLAVEEMKRTDVAPAAFTEQEMSRYLDNSQTLMPRPAPAPRLGFWKRTLAEVRSAFSIFR